jgi:predicted enzyme related to lactoylglutathione lyase
VTADSPLHEVLARAASGWASGDAAAVGDCFAAELDYVDPLRYRFRRRVDLLPFFEPPPGGHHVTWHTIHWEPATRRGAVEYTYEGHHRYHGAAIVQLDGDGRIDLWREWQHVDDERDWDATLTGPPTDATPLHAIDHVLLGMPPGDEDVARAFYGGLLALREVPKPAALAARAGLWFTGRGVSVHLGADPDHRPARRAHPAFAVDDLAAIRERLTAAGVDIEADDSDLPVARFHIRDPFGNRLELIDRWDAGFSTR